jgi:6-phosphogluconolactonase (cycloisomerase 2 family)
MSPSLLPIGDLTTKDAAFSLIQSTDQPLPFSSSNSPFGFAISPNGMNVYVGGSEGGLVWFQRNVDDGTLTYAKAWLPTDDLASALDSVEEVAISSDGQYVVAAGSDGSLYGSMGVFRAQDNGDLTLLHGGTFPEVQRVLFPPDSSTHFYTIDSSTKSVKQWRYDGTQDEFAQVGAGWTMTVNPDDAQDGYVDSISISPDGKNVYVHDASRSQSFNFKRNLDNGSLELVDVLKGDPSSTGDGLKCITDMEFSGDGTRAIAIEGCDNTLALFGRDLGTGTLSVLSVSTPVNPTGNPLALSAAFNFIIAEDDSGEIDAYIIDSGDSMLGWFRRTVYEDGTEALVLQKWFPLDPNSHYIQIDGSLTDIYTTSGGGNGVNEPWTAQHFVRSTYVADAAVDPPAQASSSGKGLSRGAAVGIGVSVAFFFMCVTVAAIYFLRRRIKKLEAQEGHYLEMLDKKVLLSDDLDVA